jgi:hypothetical protein
LGGREVGGNGVTFDEYWRQLESAGWFDAYGENTKASFRESLNRYWQKAPHYAVDALGRPAYDTEWLAEYREAPQWVVESFANASDGNFRPQSIAYSYFKKGQGRSVDTWCKLSFLHDAHEMTAEFPWLGGVAEPAMLALCNEALATSGSPFRFYETPGDQCCYVALVRPDTYEAIRKRGWLTLRELPGGEYGAPVE